MKWQNQSHKTIQVTTHIMLVLMSLFLLTACTGSNAIHPQPESTTPVESDETTAVMNMLSEAAHEFLHPGWLHFIQQASSDTDQDQNDAQQNENLVPSETQAECWLDLDENLVIQKSVCILSDLEGSIIQIGVSTIEESWIIYKGVTTAQDRIKTPYTPEIDTLADKVAKDDPDLTVSDSPTDISQEGIQLSYAFSPNSPVLIRDYDLPITKREHIYTFDPQTGMMKLYQEWVSFEESDPRIAGQIEYRVFEFVKIPPEDILQYFDREENNS